MKDIMTGLTDQDMAALEQALNTIQGILRFRKNLTEKQRSATPAMGDRRVSFSFKCFDYAKQYPDLLSGNRNITNFIRIHSDWNRLVPFLRKMRTLTQSIDDTVLLIGANLYGYSRNFYKGVQNSIDDEIPGLTTVLNELSSQYQAQGGDGMLDDEGEPKDGETGGPANQQPIPGNDQGNNVA